MKATPDENKTLITCKHYGCEIALEFGEDADADEMIIHLRNLLRFMGFAEGTIDDIMGVDNEV